MTDTTRPFDTTELPTYQHPYADDDTMRSHYRSSNLGVLGPGLEYLGDGIYEGLADLGLDPAEWSPVEATRHAYGDAGGRNYPSVNDRRHRSLYFHTHWLDAETAKQCVQEVPSYNAFSGELVADTIDEIDDETDGTAKYVFGREMSPALYAYTDQPEVVQELIETMESEDSRRKRRLSKELDELAHDRDDVTWTAFYGGLDPSDFDGSFAMTLAEYKSVSSFPGGPPDELDIYYGAETYPHVTAGDDDPTNDAALCRFWWD